ncbi:hypothetical protein BH10PAT2_BH10PAT2_2630 [soil metagenome]
MAAHRKEDGRFQRHTEGLSLVVAPEVIVPPREINYKYIEDESDISGEQMMETNQTYADFPEEYSDQEYKPESLSDMWEYVLKKYLPILQSLPTDAKVALYGVGTGSQRILFALLRDDINIFASDFNVNMIKVAEDKLIWENIQKIAKFLNVVDKKNWIGGVLDLISQINNKYKKSPTETRYFHTENMIEDILERTSLVQKDIRFLDYPPKTFDMSMAIAVLPHIPKSEVVNTILGMLRVLKAGGTCHFNLRADMGRWNEEEAKGRVFWDDVIGGRRFFTTYTRYEVEALIEYLKQLVPGIQVFIDDKITPHHDKHKPEFVNFRLVLPLENLPKAA